MRRTAGPEWAAVRDRFAASDPGLLRLTAGLRVAASIAFALAVLAALNVPAPQLVAGAVAAMVATFSIRDKERRRQAVTLALGLPAAMASISLGAVLSSWTVVGDLFFIALIFGAVYTRRFGDRGFALGLICFQTYFLSLFVHASPGDLPRLYLVITVAFVCSGVVRFAVVPEPPERVLERLREAFRARLAQLVSAQLSLLDAGPDQVERALGQVRGRTARLHETAMMIQNRLAEGTPDETSANLVQRRIADAEIAAERLGLLVLTARSAESANTLTLHLPGAPLPATGRTPVREEATSLLRRDLDALRTLVLSPVTGPARSAPAELRNRLLGYRDEENLPQASPAVRDVFRGIGEAARAVLGLRMALGGEPDESQDSASAARSREELDAEDAAIAISEELEEPEEKVTGLARPTTRAATQVAVGSGMAILAGELLSSQRYYWAVLACWIVFLNTASTGEILVKGYRRVLGTVLGAVAGIGLAGLVGNHTWTALALVLVLIFCTHYTARVSYTLLSFFVTAMLGLLYTLLNTYSLEVLVLRIEETVVGALCGIVAAAVVLPVRTTSRTNQLLVTVLDRLADVTDAAVGQLSGGPAVELLDRARDLDSALGDLRSSTKPLTHPVTPLRGRRDTARYVVALLETCAYHARSLAATAELLPSNPAIAADPTLRLAGRRIAHNLDAISAHVAGRKDAPEVETGASIASLLADDAGAPRYGRVTDRVLRHLERLDEAVTGLARPLEVPSRAAGTKASG